MPPWNLARRYVSSYAYYLASIPLLNQFIDWLSLYAPFAYECVSKIGAPDPVPLIEPEPPLTTTEPPPTPTSTATLPPPMITLPPLPPVSSFPWDYYAPKPDHLPMCLPSEEPIIEPTAYFENVYDAIMDFDLLCLEPGHFPDCYYNINGPLTESMLEIEWKSTLAPVFGIGFFLWFGFSVIYWHITTYPRSPLIRPTQLREPSLERRDSENSEIYEEIREAYTRQEEGFWARVKRFVRGYIPKPRRFKSPQDFVFQLPEPINVNAPTWSSTLTGSVVNTSTQQATGAVPLSSENIKTSEATNVGAPERPYSSNLTTPSTGPNVNTSNQKVPPSDKSVQTSGSVNTSAQQIPPSDQTAKSPESAHLNTPEIPSYLASRFSYSSEETVIPHLSGVVPPSNQNVQASKSVGDASRRPTSSTPSIDSSVHPLDRQVPEVPSNYNTQRTSGMYRQMEGNSSNSQTTPELDSSVTFNDQLWRNKSWPSSGSDRQFNLHTPSSVLSKSSSRQSSPMSRDQEYPIPNIVRGLRTFLPSSTSRSPSSRTGTSPWVSPQASPQAYLQYSVSMGTLTRPTSESASPWSQLSDISSVFWDQSSWDQANLSSRPSSQALSPAVAPALVSTLASAPASTLASASKIRTTTDPRSHQVDATLLRAYLERIQARSSEQRESPIPNVGPDQDPSQTTAPEQNFILTSTPI